MRYQSKLDTAAEEKITLEETIAELEKENQSFKEQYDAMVEEYEQKIKSLNETHKSRNRENIENLQTLVKELTYIEEVNNGLNEQILKEKEKTVSTFLRGNESIRNR